MQQLVMASDDISNLGDFISASRFSQGDPGTPGEWTPMALLLLMSVAAVAISMGLILSLWLLSKKFSRRVGTIQLRAMFVCAWLFSFMIYDVGMCTGQIWSLITNAPMAILHAFGTFLLDSDVSEIHSPFCNSWVFMLLYSLAHAFAAMVSMLFVIKHFGFSIIARLKMRQVSLQGPAVDETFVFWGLNDATDRLAESIRLHYSDTGGTYRMIIVNIGIDDDDRPENRTAIGRIFEMLSLRNSDMERLQDLHCLTTGTYVNLSQVSLEASDKDIIGGALRMKSLRRLLARGDNGRLHILFLSDDEAANIHAVSALLQDSTIRSLAKPATADSGTDDIDRVVFHCHARYNSIHRVIEDRNPLKGIKVRVVDSSHINVEMLKQIPQIQPVNFVDVQPDATVSSDFNALVIGFSEVGQDSVRYLYEFGSFVKHGEGSANGERSNFKLHVVDKNMADVAGTFVINSPAIRTSMPFIKGRTNPCANIVLHQTDCRSVEFWLNVKKWIPTLNYVVVATDDDELNISTAVRIFKTAIRFRSDLERLCILIRVHNDDDGHIARIVSHYNRLWAAQSKACDKKHFHQNTIRPGERVDLPLFLFGLDKQTYTYANIIDQAIERRAIEFKERYEASVNPDYEYSPDDPGKAWREEYIDMMQLAGPYAGYYPTYSALMALRRSQGQNIANSLHTQSKKLLADIALRKCGLPAFDWNLITRDNLTVRYRLRTGEMLDPAVERILNTLAQTEHLRWNASHEILGYTRQGSPGDKDEIRLSHGCLAPWHELSETIRSYDCNVVDVTLGIFNPERRIEQS